MRKKNFNLKLSSFFTAICCMVMGLFFQNANGQNPCPGGGYQCSSGDITIVRVTLVRANANHDPLPNICPENLSNLPVALKIEFNVTSQTRYGFIVVADVFINGTQVAGKKIAKCYSAETSAGIFGQGPQTRYIDTYVDGSAITWPCGSRIQLQNVYTAWDNAEISPTNP